MQKVVSSPNSRLVGKITTFGFGCLGVISLLSLFPMFGPAGKLLPAWFVTLFIPTALGFVVICFLQSVSAYKSLSIVLHKNQIVDYIWIMIAASFLVNASVHQFYAFRPEKILGLSGNSLLSTFNNLVIYLGAAGTLFLFWLYKKGQKDFAVNVLIAIAFAILIPTCNCANPFNEFWNRVLGASPMMFVPTSFAILCGVMVMRGINIWINVSLIAVTMLGTLLLGIGHITRIVW